MKLRVAILITCVVIVGLDARSVVGQNILVFDDGGEHLISEDLDETLLRVENASQLTVKAKVSAGSSQATEGKDVAHLLGGSNLVVDGGVLDPTALGRYGLFAQGESRVDVLAGRIQNMRLENSELNMTDGTILGQFIGLVLAQGAVARVAGGSVQNFDDVGFGVVAGDDSQIILTGGTLMGETDSFDAVGVQLNDEAFLSMTGGTISAAHVVDARSLTALDQTGSSSAEIRGGRLAFDIPEEGLGPHRLVRLQGDSRLTVSGGEFDLTIGNDPISQNDSRIFELSGNSRLTVSGGTFASANDPELHLDLTASDQSQVTISGRDFNLPMFEPIVATSGEISGTLLDNNDFSWTFQRAPGATIMLVPEPSGALLLVLGLTCLLACPIRD